MSEEPALFTFEKAIPEDAETLARVQARAFASDTEQYGSGPPGYDSVEWQIAAMGRDAYYKVLLDNRIIGGIIVVDEGEGNFYLHRIYIDPDFQNQGAASQAFAFIESTFPARRWTLHTPYQSYRNQRFYEKRGYKKIGEMRPDVPDIPPDFFLFYYEKIMPPPSP